MSLVNLLKYVMVYRPALGITYTLFFFCVGVMYSGGPPRGYERQATILKKRRQTI
jgi:hypothetical protein